MNVVKRNVPALAMPAAAPVFAAVAINIDPATRGDMPPVHFASMPPWRGNAPSRLAMASTPGIRAPAARASDGTL
jgi:hypothetical protein